MNDLELLNSFDILENMQNSIEDFLNSDKDTSANAVFEQVASLEKELLKQSNADIIESTDKDPVDGWSDKYVASDGPTKESFKPETDNSNNPINQL